MTDSNTPPTLSLDRQGTIRDCSDSAAFLFRCSRRDLLRRHVSVVLPELAGVDLVQDGQPNSKLRFLAHIGRCFDGLTKDGETFASELFLNVFEHNGDFSLSVIVQPVERAA